MPDNNCFAIVTVNAANVRVQPRAGTGIVGIVSLNDRLSAHDRSDLDAEGFFWIQVTVPANNMRGWLRGDLIQLSGDSAALGIVTTTVTTPETLEPEPTTEPPSPTPPTDETNTTDVLIGDCCGEIIVGAATVRSGPSLSDGIRGFVRSGTSFVITEIAPPNDSGFRWYRFEFNGADGWVREDLVSATGDCLDMSSHDDSIPVEEPEPPVVETPSGCFGIVGLSQISVRAAPTVNSTRLGMALKDTQLAVQDITDTQPDGFIWIQVDFSGRIGFVRSDLLALRGDCSGMTNDDRLPTPVAARVTQGFRPSSNPTHNGLDFGTGGPQDLVIAIPAIIDRAHPCPNCEGEPPNIIPSTAAERTQVFNDSDWGFGYGNHVILRHNFSDVPASTQEHIRRMGGNQNHSVFVLYAHLSVMNVALGQQIPANTLIGKTGNTGFSTAEHLHMEVGFGTRWGTAIKIHPSTLFNVANI